MSAVEVLRRAKAWILEHGWCRGQYFGPADQCCILGACARGSSLRITDAEELVNPVLEPLIDGTLVSMWNDYRGRTQGEVIALLDRAIALEATL